MQPFKSGLVEIDMERIGVAAYNYLKRLPAETLTDQEREKIEAFEKGHELTEEQKKKQAEYFLKVNQKPQRQVIEMNKDILWWWFNKVYLDQNGKKYEINKETLSFVSVVFHYFLKDDSFFNELCLTDLSKPSFEKGLLIIGGFGVGKTSIMKAMQGALQQYLQSFAIYNINEVVNDYEGCQDQNAKSTFWHKMTNGQCLFDDVKTERNASNYGKANLFKDVIERRYASGKLTHITCNYDPNYEGDIEAGLNEFGVKYGGRVYDRLFEMFNIVEFKGQSFRR